MFLSLALVSSILAVPAPEWLKGCPKTTTLQSDYVKASFDPLLFADGKTYYEIAYKDMTQPRMCSCITSKKTLNGSTINDAFALECAGKSYGSSLVFSPTDTLGFYRGKWNQAGKCSCLQDCICDCLISKTAYIYFCLGYLSALYRWFLMICMSCLDELASIIDRFFRFQSLDEYTLRKIPQQRLAISNSNSYKRYPNYQRSWIPRYSRWHWRLHKRKWTCSVWLGTRMAMQRSPRIRVILRLQLLLCFEHNGSLRCYDESGS